MDKVCKLQVRANFSQFKGQWPALLPNNSMLYWGDHHWSFSVNFFYVKKKIKKKSHLRTPKGQYVSLFSRKVWRPGVRIKLKETSSFNFKNDHLKNREQGFSGHLLMYYGSQERASYRMPEWQYSDSACQQLKGKQKGELHKIPEAQSQCWAEDKTTPQFGNWMSGSQMSHSEDRRYTPKTQRQEKPSILIGNDTTSFVFSHEYFQALSSPRTNLFHLYIFK